MFLPAFLLRGHSVSDGSANFSFWADSENLKWAAAGGVSYLLGYALVVKLFRKRKSR